MRILHLDAGKEMRGGQWQVLRLIGGLAALGMESTLLARPGAPLFDAARKAGWRVEPIGWLRTVMLARRHDLLHAHDARSHTLGAIVVGAPLIVSRRVAFPIGSRWKYRRASRYIAVSEFVKSVLIEGGVSAEKTSVVYDGVPVLDQSSGDRLLTPANLDDPQKGATLAAAAARLAGMELHVATNLERDLRQAAVFLYLTHSEGLGSAALMAMSAGVAVVASNTGGLREIVDHRRTGLLVENDPQAVAAALRELSTDRDLARRLGHAARATVTERFTVDQMVRRTIEVYRQALA